MARSDLKKVVEEVYCGRPTTATPGPTQPPSRLVKVFVSCTESDTQLERLALLQNVYPDVQRHCQQYGLDFQLVDLFGYQDEFFSSDHEFAALRMKELDEALQLSEGPFYLAILGTKWGEAVLPRFIDTTEFSHIRDCAFEAGKDINLLDEWYQQDCLEDVFVLQPISSKLKHFYDKSEENVELREKDVSKWLKIYSNLLELLQLSSQYAHDEGLINDEVLPKYWMSAVENEFFRVMYKSEEAGKNCLCVCRNIDNMPLVPEHHELGKYVNLRSKAKPKYDKMAQDRLKLFKETTICLRVPPDNILTFGLKWTEKGLDPEGDAHQRYLKDFGRKVAAKLKVLVDRHMASQLENPLHSLQSSPAHVYNSALEHLLRREEVCQRPVGHKPVLAQLKATICACKNDLEKLVHPIVVHGGRGAGKTTVLSKVARAAFDWLGPNAVSVVRYAGHDGASGSVRDIIRSICQQLTEAYGLQPLPVPHQIEKLVKFFLDLLNRVSNSERPLLIAVDGVEEVLSPATLAGGKPLQWLPQHLPTAVYMVLTLDSQSGAVPLLREKLGESSLVRVEAVGRAELPDLTRVLAGGHSVTVNPDRLAGLVACFSKRELSPLYLKLLCLYMQFSWPSGNGKELPRSLDVLVDGIFGHLEEKYGNVVISYIMRFLSAGFHGVSEAELLDLLTCSDTVMHSVYPRQLPSILRFPPQLWASIRKDLGSLLMLRRVDGKTLLVWCNRALRQLATDRYLSSCVLHSECHRDFVDLFLQVWVKQKPVSFVPGRSMAAVDNNRRIAGQPLLYGETRYNLRRLSELPFHLIHSVDIEKLKEVAMCNFEFLLAKCHALSVYSLLADFDEAFHSVLDPELEIVHTNILCTLNVLGADPLQLAAELIGRLTPIRADYPGHLDTLIGQAMDWCDAYNQPLLIPLTFWLRSPFAPLVMSIDCPDMVWMAADKDGQTFVYASGQGSILRVHAATNKVLKEYSGQEGDVTCIQLSHDRKSIFTGSTDKCVRVWDTETGKLMACMKGHTESITCLAISHSDLRVFSGALDNKVYIHLVSTGACQQVLDQHAQDLTAITSLACSRGDEVVVAASADCTIKIWSLEDYQLLETLDHFEAPIICMTLSDDNTFLLAGCKDSQVTLISLCTGSEVHRLEQHTGKAVALGITSNSTYAVLGTDDSQVYIYNMRTGQLIQTYSDHTGPIHSVYVCGQDHLVYTASQDNTTKVWNLARQPSKTEPDVESLQSNDWVSCLAISKNGAYAITGSTNGTIKIWSLETVQVVLSLQEHEKCITAVDVSEDCTFAVSGSEDKTVKVWSMTMGLVVVTFTEHKDAISSVIIETSCQQVLSADVQNCIKVWKSETGEILISCSGPSKMVYLTPDSSYAVSGNQDEKMKIWAVSSMESVHHISHVGPITCVTLTKDSKYCITGSEDQSLKIWEIKTGKLTQILVGHDDSVLCVDISAHNQHVISGSADHTLITWNMSTGEIEKTLTGHTDQVTCVKMTIDGSMAISGSLDKTLKVWSVQRGSLVTSFHMHIPVLDLHMAYDASHIIVRLKESSFAPLLSLHNSPATDVKSQSQVDIDVNDPSDSGSAMLPIKPKPPLVTRMSGIAPPVHGRMSTAITPEPAKLILNNHPVTPSKSTSQNSLSSSEDKLNGGKLKKNRKSGVCSML